MLNKCKSSPKMGLTQRDKSPKKDKVLKNVGNLINS
jgi:hypothetical protein